MGWTDSHLHRFEKDGKYCGVPEDSEDDDTIDENRTKISAILTTPGDSMLYVYDFGDDWRHEMVLEKILAASGTIVRPVCLAGERHCPPEDGGGTSGYEEFLGVIFESVGTVVHPSGDEPRTRRAFVSHRECNIVTWALQGRPSARRSFW